MIDRPAGSYIIDEKGNLRPNENDEAMVARYGLDKLAKKAGAQKTPAEEEPKEVTGDVEK